MACRMRPWAVVPSHEASDGRSLRALPGCRCRLPSAEGAMTTAQALTVAIQGERGAFSHQAALEALGAEIESFPRTTFDGLFEAVGGIRADRALVPIENSLAGSVHENYD